ncbi:MAG: DUF5058 family protein [Eubacteriales bacterium]|nr:DUF5058 family protein [Eubacteriales bacterium]
MDFKEDKFMVGLAIGVVIFVIAQAVFFLVRAIKRAKKMGIEGSVIKNTAVSSALFTIAPAIGIVATVLTLSAGLGYVLPWIRLTVIGNISYEVTAATNAIEAYGLTGGIANEITDPEVFGTIAWVMTLGSIMPLVLIPIFLKKIQSKIGKAASKNSAWSSVMSAAAFIGLIAAFVARAIAGKGDANIVGDGAGVLSVAALLFSIVLMLILQKIADVKQWKWLESFAMPFAMIGAMAFVMLLAQVLPENIAFFEWRG